MYIYYMQDNAEIFYNDTLHSARGAARPPLIRTLADGSGPAVEWLQVR
jgi:succinate dehydrogenase/fumarate reductase flavoprotein subunit